MESVCVCVRLCLYLRQLVRVGESECLSRRYVLVIVSVVCVCVFVCFCVYVSAHLCYCEPTTRLCMCELWMRL